MINAITNDRRVKTIDAIVHSSPFRVLKLSDRYFICYKEILHANFVTYPKIYLTLLYMITKFPHEGTGVDELWILLEIS